MSLALRRCDLADMLAFAAVERVQSGERVVPMGAKPTTPRTALMCGPRLPGTLVHLQARKREEVRTT